MTNYSASQRAQAELELRRRRQQPKGYTRPNIPFVEFKHSLFPRYEHAPHLDIIDTALMDAMRYVETQGAEGHGFQLFSMPPRHGKTKTISQLFPAYAIGEHPEWRVILASYGQTLAAKNSRAARNFIQAPRYRAYYPQVALATDSRAGDAWDITGFDGGMDAMGVGGGVTGKGGHLIIVDDPVKSREEAESEVYREKTWDWFTDDLYTRREPGAAIIVVMTRWHMDDLAGRLLTHEPDKWRVINFPAIAEDRDVIGRQAGDALWPERFPITVLRDIENTLAPYAWSALYQQRPTPAEGGVFKRAWFEPLLNQTPEIARSIRAWDLAMSEKTSADYTVGVKIGEATDGHYYILDVVRKQVEWGDLTPFIAETILADGAEVVQGIEEKGFMSRAITELNQDPRLHGYAIFGYPVDKDKLTRALPFAAKLSAGVVHTVNAHWSQTYVEEMCSFPNGMHDDCVDASSLAWTMIGDSNYMGGMNYVPETTFSPSDW